MSCVVIAILLQASDAILGINENLSGNLGIMLSFMQSFNFGESP
jgi:hypothetical protein